MAFRMSEQPRTIKIYNLLVGTNEFIGEGDAYIPPHTGLPANSTDIAPPDIPAGFVAVFNSDGASWHLVEDHRGKTVYDVASGDALFISELGPLPENVTWLSPGGEYQKWNGTAWFMTWLPATRYLFLNSVRYRKMLPGCRREGNIRSGTAQPG